MPGPKDWFTADLPEITQAQARRLVISVGTFWACFAIAVPLFDRPIAMVPFLAAFPAGLIFYSTLFRLWGTRFVVLPGREMFREASKQYTAMFSLFRPSFIRRAFRATAWPPLLVGCVLLALLLAALVSTTWFPPPDQPICETPSC